MGESNVSNCPDTPLVSVIVPTYQHAPYIEQCIESILLQITGFAVEILIGEDESSDGTREICQRYAEQYPERIRLFLGQRKHVISIMGRPTGRRNLLRLMGEARGRYIALCEGDDYWTDQLKLQKQVDLMERNAHWSACFHRVRVKYEQGQNGVDVDFPLGVTKLEHVTEDFLDSWFVPTCSLLYRNEPPVVLPEWIKTTLSADIPLLLLLSLRGPIGYLADVMGVYRIHGAGLSRTTTHQGYDKVRGMAHLYELFNAHTGFQYNDRIREAFIKEIRMHLPEVKELKALKASQVPPLTLLDRAYYFAWVRFPALRSILDLVRSRKRK